MSVFEGGLNGALPPALPHPGVAAAAAPVASALSLASLPLPPLPPLPPLLSAARRRRPETTAPTICAA